LVGRHLTGMHHMSAERYSLDTNILIYCIDGDAGDRHQRAIQLMQEMITSDCTLTLQSLSEFFSVATRKGKMPKQDAIDQINDWMTLFPIIHAVPTTLKIAMNAVWKHQFSFWDAMLVETSVQAGVTHLYSEDMQHRQIWKGMTIENPF